MEQAAEAASCGKYILQCQMPMCQQLCSTHIRDCPLVRPHRQKQDICRSRISAWSICRWTYMAGPRTRHQQQHLLAIPGLYKVPSNAMQWPRSARLSKERAREDLTWACHWFFIRTRTPLVMCVASKHHSCDSAKPQGSTTPYCFATAHESFAPGPLETHTSPVSFTMSAYLCRATSQCLPPESARGAMSREV